MTNFLQDRANARKAAYEAKQQLDNKMHEYLKSLTGQINGFYSGNINNIMAIPERVDMIMVTVNDSNYISISISRSQNSYSYTVTISGKPPIEHIDETALADVLLDTLK